MTVSAQDSLTWLSSLFLALAVISATLRYSSVSSTTAIFIVLLSVSLLVYAAVCTDASIQMLVLPALVFYFGIRLNKRLAVASILISATALLLSSEPAQCWGW